MAQGKRGRGAASQLDLYLLKQLPAEDRATILKALGLLQTLVAASSTETAPSGIVAASVAPTALTHYQIWERFKLELRIRAKKTWKCDHRRFVRHVLIWRPGGGPRFAHLPFTESSKHLVNVYRLGRQKEISERTGRVPTTATINREVMVWRWMLNWAEREGMIQRNPIAQVELERENNVRKTTLREPSMEKVFESCDLLGYDQLKAIILTFWDTGLRRKELLFLRKDKVDWDTGEVKGLVAKGGVMRPVYLSQRSREAIAKLPRHTASPYVFCKGNGGPGERRIRSQLGPASPPNPDVILKRFQRVCAHAGVEGVDGENIWLHTLRHTFAADLSQANVPIKEAMALMGQSTPNAHFRYGFVDQQRLRALVPKVEDMIKKRGAG